MTTQTIEPTIQFTAPAPGRFSDQAPTFEALSTLTAEFAELPRPYIVVYSSGPNAFQLQLSHPSHFEQWRTALRLPTASVELKTGGESVWLTTDLVFRGVPVHLTGHGVPLAPEQVEASQAVPA